VPLVIRLLSVGKNLWKSLGSFEDFFFANIFIFHPFKHKKYLIIFFFNYLGFVLLCTTNDN